MDETDRMLEAAEAARPLPEWILALDKKKALQKGAAKKRSKPKAVKGASADVADKNRVDHQNIRKTWHTKKENEATEAGRLQRSENSAALPVRTFPRPVRATPLYEDSPVAQFAMSHGTRRTFLPSKAAPEGGSDTGAAGAGAEPSVSQVMEQAIQDEAAAASAAAAAAAAETPASAGQDSQHFLRLDQSQLPLELFDSSEYEEGDKSPAEWLESGAGCILPFYVNGEWTTRAGKVTGYDAETRKYNCEINGKVKQVHRLNLMFDTEDKVVWENRKTEATQRRDEAKDAMRLQHYIRGQPIAAVRPMRSAILRGIHDKIADGLPPNVPFPEPGSNSAPLLRGLTADVVRGYTVAMKRAIAGHLLTTDGAALAEHRALGLPAIGDSKPVPRYGKVQIPLHEYALNKAAVAEVHYTAKPEVRETFQWLYAIGNVLGARSFTNTDLASLPPLPCETTDFVLAQSKHGQALAVSLRDDWRRAFVEQLVDNVQDVYDFFVSNEAQYTDSALQRLLKHFELRMSSQLRSIVSSSVSLYETFIGEFALDTNVDESDAHAGRIPLFNVRLVVNDPDWTGPASQQLHSEDHLVTITPSTKEIGAAILGALDEMVKSVSDFQSADADLMSLLHLETRPLLELGAGHALCADMDGVISAASSSLAEKVEKAMQAPARLAERYSTFSWLMSIDTSAYVEEFAEAGGLLVPESPSKGAAAPEGVESDSDASPRSPKHAGNSKPTAPKTRAPTLEEYMDKVREFDSAAVSISQLSHDTELHALCSVDTTAAKGVLRAKALEVRDTLLEHVVAEARQQNQTVIARYEEMLATIAEKPSNEAELAKLKAFIAESKKETKQIIEDVAEIHRRLAALEEFSYAMPQEDVMLAWSTMEYPRRVEEAALDSEMALEEDKVRMMDKLALEKNRFEELLDSLEHDVKRAKVFADYSLQEQYVEEVNNLQDAIADAKKKANDFQEREKIFGFPATEYVVLDAIERELEPFYKLWNMISDFHTNLAEWLHGPFLDLDGKAIQRDVEDWWKSSYKLNKLLEDEQPNAAACAQSLRDETTTFREHLPVIQALASPALKDRHWVTLSERIGSTITPDEELTLQMLLEIDIGVHIETIQEVCVAAEKEYGLERKLAGMKADWAAMALIVVGYKTTGTFVIGGVEEIITLLDDHIVQTQTMRGSMYIKAVEGEAIAWEKQLKYAQSLIDEWLACQRTWMYLEPIFGSEDIMRQLPTEARRFSDVDKLWRRTMKDVEQEPIFIVQAEESKKLLGKFRAANEKLDKIQKGLADYLEMKRLYFPRFFFLSNDQMLEILSQTKDPRAVQPHLGKAFEGLNQVRFADDEKITHMISAEGETVDLVKMVDPNAGANKGAVERWLLDLERIQWESIRHQTEESMDEFPELPRTEWMLNWPAQVVLLVSQIYWTQEVTEIIHAAHTNPKGLSEFGDVLEGRLQDVVKLVRGKLTKLQRKTLSSLCVIDVHAQGIVEQMVAADVREEKAFEWMRELRYYWEPAWKDGQACKNGEDSASMRIVNAKCLYGYEYLGNSMRLVVTPLTDRCYRTMISAVDLLYGGAPEGPAGTGKTETVKDLSKAAAIQCVVFNCSDGMDYKAMGKFFKGLAGCGSWCCFDEFNRINVEVLSVIAQQIMTINEGKRKKVEKFLFEGSTIKLNANCNVFITMNPGYAGRAELPDNLKALFRPCAMMVPDYAMIGEIRLYSFGFQVARENAQKLVKVLQLCSEQLSSQKHYDYGMRAVNSILVAAGNLRQQLGDDPEWTESRIVLRSINDVNLPKFTVEDLPLFAGITADLFPGVILPDPDYGDLLPAIELACTSAIKVASGRAYKCEPVAPFTKKICELYEMVMVRHGVMVVGETCSGKTMSIHGLKQAMTTVNKNGGGVGGSDVAPVKALTMNPKSIKSGQLYGSFDDNTHEWSDGILAVLYRQCAMDTSISRFWLLFDGPVDAVWIENMNTVLDDNKKLCLMSGEIIKMTDRMTMMFEAEDLEEASPATVSRVGMIFCEVRNVGWRPLRNVWLNTLAEKHPNKLGDEAALAHITTLYDWLMPPMLYFVQKRCRVPTPVTPQELVMSHIRLFDVLLDIATADGPAGDAFKVLEGCFIFALLWSLGACVDAPGRALIHAYLHKLLQGTGIGEDGPHQDFLSKNPTYVGFDEQCSTAIPPSDVESALFYDYRFDAKQGKWISWLDGAPHFKIPKDAAYNSIVVPTVDTIRHTWLIDQLAQAGGHILCTGDTGVGKSVSVKNHRLLDGSAPNYQSIVLNFSAQTSANQTQDIIDSKLDKRRKGVLGPPLGTKCVIFVDDLNMPAKEEYGAQPPVEILRQWMDHAGWYDRTENAYRQLIDIQFIAAMGPPGGGRTRITQRYVRHFNLINFVPFNNESLERVFCTILDWVLSSGFAGSIKSMSESMVKATIGLYESISVAMLPTPAKSHYTFNLRDLSKVIQGVSFATADLCKDKTQFVRLWSHECMRVFHDRLVDDADRTWFKEQVRTTVKDVFGLDYSSVRGKHEALIYGNFADPKILPEKRVYAEMEDREQLAKAMDSYLEEYNSLTSKPMSLVLFQAAVEHIARIARVIQQPYGNSLLIGVGGSGRKSCTTLAVSIADFTIKQIEITRTYGMVEWRDDLRSILQTAGVENKPTVFMFDDTQIVNESFLEDVNGILNTGEVPNLFTGEDEMLIFEEIGQEAAKNGVNTSSSTEMMAYFTSIVRGNLHVVLCLSPIGEAFRRRLRMFPALVNCTTIDWFSAWPEEALRSVASHFLDTVEMEPAVREGVIDVCVDMQTRVGTMAGAFLKEVGRHYYVTPTSYLELINTFKNLLNKQRNEITEAKMRYDNGLTKIEQTAEQVGTMQNELEALQPQLKEATIVTDRLLETIAKDTIIANEKKAVVSKEKEQCDAQAAEAEELRASCQADLDIAMPALEGAMKALKELSKGDIVEVKAMKKPPDAVKMVMEAVCHMMGVKPVKIKDPDGGTKKIDDYWGPSTKQLLGNARFILLLMDYDRDNMDPAMVVKVSKFTDNPAFDPAAVKKASVAAAGLCKWVHAMIVYDKVAKNVGPKKAALKGAQETLKSAQAALATKEAVLQEVMDKLQALNDQLAAAELEKGNLAKQVADCASKLRRAEQLINGLGGERVRWGQFSANLAKNYENATGDIVLAAGVIAYLGAFLANYRADAVTNWSALLRGKNITCSDNFSLRETLGDEVQIRSWIIYKLPNDSFSIESAIMLERSNRWPLMIDPQGQANKWVKKMEGENSLKICKLSQSTFGRTIEIACQYGNPVLLENVGEALDPLLEPVLLKQIVTSGGMSTIRIGDSTVEYDPAFKLYMTTKLTNPHYPPELMVKVQLLAFLATEEGLEDQMLGITVAKEEPELEAQREQLVLEDAENKRQLKEIEDTILQLLKDAKGNILDDEVLINTLAQSKSTSNLIESKVKQAARANETISRTRAGYQPVAFHASQLFFCIADLAAVDPMYQYSLEWFIQLFVLAISNAEKADTLEGRLKELNECFTYTLYRNVCRSLFEKDKLLFSFLLNVKIMIGQKRLDPNELRFFLQGNTSLELERPNPVPAGGWLNDVVWANILALSKLKAFGGFVDEVTNDLKQWESMYNSPQIRGKLEEMYGDRKSSFQLLCIIRTLRLDRVVPNVMSWVAEEMGNKFIEPPPFDLMACYEDSTCATPLIFVLTPGADPMSELYKVADQLGFGRKLVAISLGQGQGEIAYNAISEAQDKGSWVCLQNCHLSVSWMPTLEAICEELSPDRIATNFRLWLTSEPSKAFPAYVLQNGVKMTNEPPQGMRANLTGSYMTVTDEFMEECARPAEFKKLLFGLCFFHAIVRERRKFGPLGWNIQYVFSVPDLKISRDQLKIILDNLEPEDPIPYPQLNYLAGECNYGGRVTDGTDRRCLMNMLCDYYNPMVVENDDHKFSTSGTYYAPPNGDLESYRTYIKSLPYNEGPEVFGMHENANISCAIQETNSLLNAALLLQPRSGGGEGKSWADVVNELATDISSKVPAQYDVERALIDFPIVYEECMNTVLTQELMRFNRLTALIAKSLAEIQRAMKGLVVMSAELEAMGDSMVISKVPKMWEAKSYPSLKPLGSWVNDLLLRLEFIQKWLTAKKAPPVFWISGFFFTQAFLTGTSQNYARKYKLPIDTVMYDFNVCPADLAPEDAEQPEDGAYVRGLFLESARWDGAANAITESRPRELLVLMPMVHLLPKQTSKVEIVEGVREHYTGQPDGTAHVYMCPVYKTSVRAGTLSTTGHSTNFVLFIRLPMLPGDDQQHWVKRGTAALTQTDD